MGQEIEVNILINALNNVNNESLIDLTTNKIKEINLNILKELHLPRDITLTYMKKLKGYRYVDEINDIKCGSFIKCITINDPSYLPLNMGGLICNIKIENTGIVIICKNFMHKHYQIKMEECLLFQKLTTQELILLSALDHLAKE